MGDLELQYKAARMLVLKLREGIQQLEKAEQVRDQEKMGMLSRDLQAKLLELQRLTQGLDSAFRMQALGNNTAKASTLKRKIEQVTEEEYHLRKAYESHGLRQNRRQVDDAERQELLQRNTDGRSSGWQSHLDEDSQAQNHVQNSKRIVEELLQNGASILVDMSGQRERLKSAHRKMLDALNSVGLSDSLLRVIERRQVLDKWLVYGGMVFLVLFVMVIIWWRK